MRRYYLILNLGVYEEIEERREGMLIYFIYNFILF